MKIYGLVILRKTNDASIQLCSAYDLSSFGYFQRKSVEEFMNFTAGIVVKNTERGTRTSIREKEYLCHGYIRNDSLSAIAICDQEYPQREAFTMLTKIMTEFSCKISEEIWTKTVQNNSVIYSDLQNLLIKYQNPKEIDMISKVQAELDETKLIVCDTIEKVLNRGEKLDDLVAKSEGLSQQSKLFYKTARKTNSCCGGL